MEGLLQICREHEIWVSYQPLYASEGRLGMFFRDAGGRPIIILDTSLLTQPRLERCILAEEIGHYFTTPTSTFFVVHFSYSAAVTLSRDDSRALRWASNYLMPTPALAEAVKRGLRTVDELAEHFEVTPWMVWRKLHFLRADLREEQGLRVKVRDLFAPILVDRMWGQAR